MERYSAFVDYTVKFTTIRKVVMSNLKKKGLSRTARFWILMLLIGALNASFIAFQCFIWGASKHFMINTDFMIWLTAIGGTIVFLVSANVIFGATCFLMDKDPDKEEILREVATHQPPPVEEKLAIVIEEPEKHPQSQKEGREFLQGFVAGSAITALITTLLRRR